MGHRMVLIGREGASDTKTRQEPRALIARALLGGSWYLATQLYLHL